MNDHAERAPAALGAGFFESANSHVPVIVRPSGKTSFVMLQGQARVEVNVDPKTNEVTASRVQRTG